MGKYRYSYSNLKKDELVTLRENALNSFQQSLAINKVLKNNSGMATDYSNIGSVYKIIADEVALLANDQLMTDSAKTLYDLALIYSNKSLDLET